jgi:hypothetical protein
MRILLMRQDRTIESDYSVFLSGMTVSVGVALPVQIVLEPAGSLNAKVPAANNHALAAAYTAM